jgi:putative Mg2+ transporter-C (MgtC) family protein
MNHPVEAVDLIKLVLASVLGALIGLEREIHGRPAGFRTHLLVSLGSCLFVMTSVHFYDLYGNFSGTIPVGVDPGRVAAQVVTGIGFLGAGAIIREKASIRGLTTAACLWIASAIGLACGVGLYSISMAVTVMSLISLLLLKKVESMLKRDTYLYLRVWSEDLPERASIVESLVAGCGAAIINKSLEKNIEKAEIHLIYHIKYNVHSLSSDPVQLISDLPGMKRVALGQE